MQSWEECEKEQVRECAVSHQAAGLAPGFVKRAGDLSLRLFQQLPDRLSLPGAPEGRRKAGGG